MVGEKIVQRLVACRLHFGIRGLRTGEEGRIRQAVDLRRERPEPGAVGLHLAGERHGHQSAAMVTALKGHDALPTAEAAGHLDGVFHGLGAAVEETGLGRLGHRCQGVQALGQHHITLVHGHVKAGVQRLLHLPAGRRHHPGVIVADVEDADAAAKVQITAPLHIPDMAAPGPFHEDGRHVKRPPGHRPAVTAFQPLLIGRFSCHRLGHRHTFQMTRCRPHSGPPDHD